MERSRRRGRLPGDATLDDHCGSRGIFSGRLNLMQVIGERDDREKNRQNASQCDDTLPPARAPRVFCPRNEMAEQHRVTRDREDGPYEVEREFHLLR